MKKVGAFVLLSMFALFPIFASSTMNRSWLQKDEAIINSTLKFIKTKDFEDEKIKKLIYKNKVLDIESHEQGFGLQRFSGGIPGGYMGINIEYIAYDGAPCKLIFTVYKDDFDKIKDHIDKKISKEFLRNFSSGKNCYGTDVYSKVIDFSGNYKKYLEHKKSLIGDIKKLSIPKEYQKYYDFLFYCEYKTEYGYLGGIAAEKPLGREAMEELLKLNDKQIFINLLKGDNPCGRVYAAEGLLRLENTEENVNIINEILSPLIEEGITYSTIGGCIVISGNKYQIYEYDENYNLEEYDYWYGIE